MNRPEDLVGRGIGRPDTPAPFRGLARSVPARGRRGLQARRGGVTNVQARRALPLGLLARPFPPGAPAHEGRMGRSLLPHPLGPRGRRSPSGGCRVPRRLRTRSRRRRDLAGTGRPRGSGWKPPPRLSGIRRSGRSRGLAARWQSLSERPKGSCSWRFAMGRLRTFLRGGRAPNARGRRASRGSATGK